MPENAVAVLDVAAIAASSLALPRRAEQLLALLRRLVSFDGAWLALADPHQAPDIDARALAAVRAERAGHYVPCVPGLARGEAL